MPGVNRVFLVGHAGIDPELRLANDIPVLRFSLATSEILIKKNSVFCKQNSTIL